MSTCPADIDMLLSVMNTKYKTIEFLEKELNIKGEIEHDFLFYYKYICKDKIFNVKEIKKIVDKWVDQGLCILGGYNPDNSTLQFSFTYDVFEDNDLKTKTPRRFFFENKTNYISFIQYV